MRNDGSDDNTKTLLEREYHLNDDATMMLMMMKMTMTFINISNVPRKELPWLRK